MSARDRRGRQAAWAICLTLVAGCIASAVTRNPWVAAGAVAAAWGLAFGARFRERVEAHHATRTANRGGLNSRMGEL